MARYNKDIMEKHKAIIKRMVVLNPSQPILQMVESLKAQNLPFSRDYVTKLVRKVHGEWMHKYDRETKVMAVAKAEEMFEYLIQHLRKIIQDEEVIYNYTLGDGKDKMKVNKIRTFSQMNRIQAIKEIREIIKTIMDMKMDAGILERKLGEIEVEFKIANLKSSVKDLYEYRKRNGINIKDAEVIKPTRKGALPIGHTGESN